MIMEPWIAKLLSKALDFYLFDATETQVEDPPFRYESDYSNLTIAVRADVKAVLHLLEIRKNKSGNVLRARATDGEIEVDTTFLRGALDLDTGKLQPAPGAILTVHSFEFRLASYAEPPRVVLHVKAFAVSGISQMTKASTLLSIHKHYLASPRLQNWKSAEDLKAMDLDTDSLAEIKSQVGDQDDTPLGSNEETRHPSSTSQPFFATQIPYHHSPKKQHHDSRQPVHSQEPLGRDTPDESLVSKHNHLSPKLAVRQSLQAAKSEPTNGIVSSTAELTQRQLVVPSSSVTIRVSEDGQHRRHRDSAPLEEDTDGLLGMSNGQPTPAPSQPMPEAVAQLFRNWRRECREGRYIPHRLQVIPKDQAKLLESDDRWQPPLVGRAQRPGTVPLDLLNSLTDKADSKAEQARAAAHNVQTTDDGIQEAEKTDQEQERERNVDNSDQGSEDSEPVEWSSSPLHSPTAQRALPPDSSPLGPTHSNRNQTQDCGDLTVEPHITETDHLAPTDRAPRVIDEGSDEVFHDAPHHLDHDDIEKPSSVEKSEHLAAQASKLPPPSTLNAAVDAAGADLQRTVQVKRTPFHVETAMTVDDIPESSSNFVPGTFDERHGQRRVDIGDTLAKGISSEEDQAPVQHHSAFEADSSKDEVVSGVGRSAENLLKPAESATGSRVPKSTDPKNTKSSHETVGESNGSTLKRRTDDIGSKSSKRVRDDRGEFHKSDARDSDYNLIDKDRIQYRRLFLGSIAKKQDTGDRIVPALASRSEAQEASASLLIQPNQVSSSSPMLTSADHSDTSDTHTSLHKIAKHIPNPGAAQIATSTVSDHKEGNLSQLYARFKTTYPDYDGQKKDFDASCLLLKRLHLRKEDTHPSLWDDFIFRHFHEYRSYLQEVIDGGDSALPYQEYYEMYVEQPTHLRRVVKPSNMDDFTFGLASNMRRDSYGIASESKSRMTRDSQSKEPTSGHEVEPTNSDSNGAFPSSPQSAQAGGETASQTKEHLSQAREQSQNSQTSVKRWLERTAGAESPILGTPDMIAVRDVDIPTIEPNQEKARPTESVPDAKLKRRRRTLPWVPTAIPQDTSSPPISNRRPIVSETPKSSVVTCVTSSRTDTLGHGSPAAKEDKLTAAATATTPSTKPGSSGSNSRLPPHRDTSRVKSERASLLLSCQSESSTATASGGPRVETAFTRFARFYNELASEKKALEGWNRSGGGGSGMTGVDMFKWRN